MKAKQLLHWTLAEIRKRWQTAWSYRVTVLIDQVFFIIGFLLLSGLFESVTEDTRVLQHKLIGSLLGYLTWRVAGGCMLDLTSQMADERQWGVWSQICLTQIGFKTLLFSRFLASFFYYTVRVVVMGVILLFLLRLTLPLNGFVFIALTAVYVWVMVGALGVSLVIIAFDLRYPGTYRVTSTIATLLLFLSGAIYSVADISVWRTLSYVLPFGPGIELMRNLLLNPDTSIDAYGLVFWIAVLNSLVYAVIGLVVVQLAYDTARRTGQLSHI